MASEHERDVLAWRARRVARLTSPEGWLAVVGLWWLADGPNRVGADPASAVVLPSGAAPPAVGTILLRGSKARFEADPSVRVTHRGEAVTSIELRDDTEGEPTTIEVGRLRVHLIRRYGRLAVRVRDPEAPAVAAFAGIGSYPIDARWRFDARFEPYPGGRTSSVPTVLDQEETYDTPGALAFELDGRTLRVDAFLEPGETDLFVVFGDLTNRDETYGGGRYLYTAPPDGRGRVVLDFNKAYNPPCVFTAHATCALPLPQNRLPLRVEAGERRYPPGSVDGDVDSEQRRSS